MLERNRRRVAVAELELGMYVCELDRPWSESPFLFQGFPLTSPEDLEQVRQLCNFVYVDDLRRVLVSHSPHRAAPSRRAPSTTTTTELNREVRVARVAHGQGTALIKDVLTDVQLGRGINTAAARQTVRQYMESMMRNESAMLWLIRLKTADEYTAQHCLAVAVLAMGFARHLGCTDDEIETAGLCGLLHDVGKMKVDPAVLNKPGRLTEAEFAQMKRHTTLGYQILLGQKDLPGSVVDVAHGHHERLDGAGYPRGLKEQQISQLTRMIAICDCYDAITSHRCYDGARSPKEAFKVLMDARDTHLEASKVLAFINWLGVFPVGSIVQLQNGQIAVVLESHVKRRLRPRVAVLRDEHGQPTAPRVLDLSILAHAGDESPWRIRDSLPDGSFNLHLAGDEVQALLSTSGDAEGQDL